MNNSTANALAVRCVRDAGGTRALTRAGVGDVAVGQTYGQVRTALTSDMFGKLFADGGAIPMWGESPIVTIAEATPDIHVNLHRAIARIDVGVGTFDENAPVPTWGGLANFTMTSATVVRPNNAYAVIPAAANVDAAHDPTAPTVVGMPYTIADSATTFTYSGSSIYESIYIPEAEIVDTPYADRMAMVVGGHYNGSADVQYYRVEFRQSDGALIDVVRNHLYRFDITQVHGPGLHTIEDAYNAMSTYIVANVVGWNEIGIPSEIGR